MAISDQIVFTGQAYRNFIETIHSPYMRETYRNSLSLYLRYRGFNTCEQLLEGDPKIIQSQLVDYIIYLREELQISQYTINGRIAAVKKFYETNDIELRWSKIKSYIGRGTKRKNRKDRPYTHAEIAKMLEKADQRGRIAILLMFSAGLRVGAITSLKIRDLEKIEKYQLYKIKVYENDDGEYTTCYPIAKFNSIKLNGHSLSNDIIQPLDFYLALQLT
jgi:integrase